MVKHGDKNWFQKCILCENVFSIGSWYVIDFFEEENLIPVDT